MAGTSTSTRALSSKRGQNTPVCELWIKKTVLLLVAMLVLNTVAVSQPTHVPRPDQIKAEVQKRGVNSKSKIRVKLVGGAEVRGYISKIEDASFEVTDKTSGQPTIMPYSNVERVKGAGMPTVAKIGIVVGIAVVVGALVIAKGINSAKIGRIGI